VPVPTIPLSGGLSVPDLAIPQLGFGVYQVQPAETVDTVTRALEIGYRHIDTAEMYQNEAEVGEAVERFGRDEVFLTSKLNNGFHRPDDARRAFDETLRKLRTDTIDLFLIHWPLPTLYDGDYVSTWRTLTEFLDDGRARSVGVSNFSVVHLERLAAETDVVPAVNQIEVHPYFTNEQVRAYDAEHGIVTEAWSPIAQGKVLDDPAVTQVASALGKTPAQAVLRWHVQRGDVVFPKSTTPSRMQENFEIFDFELDDEQMRALSSLDRGEPGRTGPNPDTFDYVPD
jgi:2,5-diketo-D-gluconate reductase A